MMPITVLRLTCIQHVDAFTGVVPEMGPRLLQLWGGETLKLLHRPLQDVSMAKSVSTQCFAQLSTWRC